MVFQNSSSQMFFISPHWRLILSVLVFCKGTLVRSWEKGLIISKDDDDFVFSYSLVAWLAHYIRFSVLTSIAEVLIFLLALLIYIYSIIEWGIWVCIIDSMVCQKTVHELDIFAPKEFNHLCNKCKNNKSHYLPLSRSRASQYSKMKLLIMGWTRSMFISTWDGYLYVLVVVEVRRP